MFAAKWFLVPSLCAAIGFGACSPALAVGKHAPASSVSKKHHPAKKPAAKKVVKPASMSKTTHAPKKHAPAKKKHVPASHSTKPVKGKGEAVKL
ncbi:MAG TPA: hypothetical protein VGP72_02660 [Planctomycetota bacterium]|jgi:hypothetical protein